jgi:hypothetical protein
LIHLSFFYYKDSQTLFGLAFDEDVFMKHLNQKSASRHHTQLWVIVKLYLKNRMKRAFIPGRIECNITEVRKEDYPLLGY